MRRENVQPQPICVRIMSSSATKRTAYIRAASRAINVANTTPQVLPMSVLDALDGLTRLEMANNQLQIIPDDIGKIKYGRCMPPSLSVCS
jgi:hypothetical protein